MFVVFGYKISNQLELIVENRSFVSVVKISEMIQSCFFMIIIIKPYQLSRIKGRNMEKKKKIMSVYNLL